MTEEINNTLKEKYFLRGQPVLTLFNYSWNLEIKGDLSAFIIISYNTFSNNPSFFDNLENIDSVHLAKFRSESCGRYGNGIYGCDEDLILCKSSLVNIKYDSVNPDFNIPIEKSTCKITLASSSANIEMAKKRLEEICGQNLEKLLK
ncbi:MAG: hypothetical protein WC781_02030 [Candidatus Pacearchaeota archaeon]|jgi:hypothetical protein